MAAALTAAPPRYRLEPALDWSRCRVSFRPGLCRVCGGPALLQDPDGVPCHKVCMENQLVERLGWDGAKRHAASLYVPRTKRREGAA